MWSAALRVEVGAGGSIILYVEGGSAGGGRCWRLHYSLCGVRLCGWRSVLEAPLFSMWSAALRVEVSTISDPLSEDLLYKRIFLIYPLRMDMDRYKMAERILHLTLEILFRLTGEDYTVVKKTSSERCQDPVSEGLGRPLSPVTGTPPHLIHEDINDQKILELAYKMIELLTGEVPIRCQDVAVYFSMEEWEYLAGHKDVYKDIIMEVPQPLTSPVPGKVFSPNHFHPNAPPPNPGPGLNVLTDREFTNKPSKARQADSTTLLDTPCPLLLLEAPALEDVPPGDEKERQQLGYSPMT
ncbi:uncharacterized protein LOC143768234 [Ranitomeya variabilis]|uniref:uncharacterized protein LOC143768234 n=1 Tax=Ranitomeya variabilis TaxID=490064 RepID=UPI0040561BFB